MATPVEYTHGQDAVGPPGTCANCVNVNTVAPVAPSSTSRFWLPFKFVMYTTSFLSNTGEQLAHKPPRGTLHMTAPVVPLTRSTCVPHPKIRSPFEVNAGLDNWVVLRSDKNVPAEVVTLAPAKLHSGATNHSSAVLDRIDVCTSDGFPTLSAPT